MKDKRMKQNKWLNLGAMLLVLCLFVTGCGNKVSVKSLFESANKNADKIKSVDMDMILNMECKIESEDASMTMGMDLDANIKAEQEKGTYIEGEAKVNMLGTDMTVPVKSYTILDGDNTLVYSYNPSADSWTYEEKEADDTENFSKGLAGMDFSKIYNNLELQKDLEDYNCKKCYKVTGEFKGSDVKGLIGMLGDSLEESGIDADSAEYFKADAEFYFDKSSKNLTGMKMDFAGSDWEKLMSSSSDGNSMSTLLGEDTKMSMSVFEVEIKLNDTDNYKFELPDDVKKEAQKTGDADIDALLDLEGDEETDLDDEDSELEEEDSKILDSDLDAAKGIFKLEGEESSFSDVFAKLDAAGWAYDTEINDSETVAADDFGILIFSKGEKSISVWVTNSGSEEKSYKDCEVTGVSDSNIDNGILELDGGIQIGSSYEDVIGVFGDAGDVYEDDNFKSLEYEYQEAKLTISIMDDAVSGIDLETETN